MLFLRKHWLRFLKSPRNTHHWAITNKKNKRVFLSALCIKTAYFFWACQVDACNFKCKSACAIFRLDANSVYLISCSHKQLLSCVPRTRMGCSDECGSPQIFLKQVSFPLIQQGACQRLEDGVDVVSI